MPDRDEPLDALTRLLAEGGPAWLEFFAPAPEPSEARRRRAYRGDEAEPGAETADVPVAIFHDVERGAGEHREVSIRLVDTPLERGRELVALVFAWPDGAFADAVPRRASCRLLLDDDVLDVGADDATCAWLEDECRLELRLGADWVELDRRPDALLASLHSVLVILHASDVAIDGSE
ncbi:MAG: hypothetical protein EA416_12270 [Trueperaceae bacterium]|nr:MAG: hypothetical protein EA416_12270 [Trueperaceae bacterium]